VPIAEREHGISFGAVRGLRKVLMANIPPGILKVGNRIVRAKKKSGAIILMMGAHVLRSGVQRYIIDLMERGYISCLAMNDAGKHNLRNICESFGCDMISLDLNPDLVRRMVRIAFEELGSPTWPIDRAIYTFPIRMAINMNIQFVIYGENVSWEYGGVLDPTKETYRAKDQINNDVAKKVDFSMWLEKGVSQRELNMLMYPSEEEIEKACLVPIYLSYFIPWDGYRNYQIAKRYGFRDLTHEWKREGYIEDYDQIDSIAYLMNVWMKYPKFGFARATDVVGYWIRSGKISREQGASLIREHDHKLDQRILDDFMAFTGYSDKEFWDITEKFWNRELFEKINWNWKLKKENHIKQVSDDFKN